MEGERRRRILFGVGVVVLALTAYLVWRTPSVAPTSSSRRGGQPTSAARTLPDAETPDVHLHALEEERPKPVTGERNLFRFKPKPPPPQVTTPPVSSAPTGPPAPAPPPPLPPITFKFIGIVEAPERSAKIAVLSDGRNVFHGREGDIIEGRYRVLRIGAESIEMAYLDGRGRQTIRLTGS